MFRLQLHEAEKGQQFDYGSFERGNFIIFYLNQKVFLVQSEFKTSQTTGPIKSEISDDNELIYYLRLYVHARHMLMLGIVTIIFFAINRAIRSHAVAQLQSIYKIYLSTRFRLVSYAACSRVRGFLPTYRLLTAATHSVPIV